MNQESSQAIALQIFEEAGAVLDGGHYCLSAGKHCRTYINKDAVNSLPASASVLCRMIADNFSSDRVEVVVAPALGGIVLSQWTAHHLGSTRGTNVWAVFAEKLADNRRFVISRGYDELIAGRRVLVVEDVLTTGETTNKVIGAVRDLGAEVVGVGALWNRGGVTAAGLGDVPKLVSLINQKIVTWNPEDCPLCAEEVPLNAGIGHAKALAAGI